MISWQISIVFYEFKSWMLMITPGSYDLSYHRNFLMVFKATITIEWNGWGQPLSSVVFRWFLGPQPSCSMVVHHRSNDALVTYYRSSLIRTLNSLCNPLWCFRKCEQNDLRQGCFFLHLACKMLFWRRNRILERIEYQLPGVGCPLTQMLSRFMATHHRPQNMKAI